ncbi:MAG: hypothetical protein LBJ10_00585 [Clostridiales bacterium]|jgi:DMSO/TMAO reductase YedYZ heme-binding membrane subunit|nr:hypothetical protein [Clostridiales bacterium]
MDRLIKLRIFILMPLALSFCYTLVSFVLYAGASLPYQDATAEMLTRQTEEMARLEKHITAGAVAFLLLLAMLITLSAYKSKKS